ILQFVLPLFGYPSPFVTEWWIKDQLARANGFSYEPSYLGTYLLIGFVFVGALIKKPEAVLSQHLLGPFIGYARWALSFHQAGWLSSFCFSTSLCVIAAGGSV